MIFIPVQPEELQLGRTPIGSSFGASIEVSISRPNSPKFHRNGARFELGFAQGNGGSTVGGGRQRHPAFRRLCLPISGRSPPLRNVHLAALAPWRSHPAR